MKITKSVQHIIHGFDIQPTALTKLLKHNRMQEIPNYQHQGDELELSCKINSNDLFCLISSSKCSQDVDRFLQKKNKFFQ